MNIRKISLFSMLLACCSNMPAMARINVKGTNNYVQIHNQMNEMRNQQYYASQQPVATTNSDTGELPVAVDDEGLVRALKVGNAEGTTVKDLEACSMIYPSGLFRWGIPDSGMHRVPVDQCVAVVELRDINNTVLAVTTLAAGDAMKCNVDMFPVTGRYDVLNKIEVPADKEPTVEDVEAVMNEEQKQNAGLKIAAAAILSGVAGNMLAPKEAGDTKLMGTGKTQLLTTAGSAVAGAGIMAASTYSGRVAGDTIKATAVNATAGMVVGNMTAGMSGAGSVLATTKCTINGTEHDCIIGKMSKTNPNDQYDYKGFDKTAYGDKPAVVYFINRNRQVMECGLNASDTDFSHMVVKGQDQIYLKCSPSSSLVKIITDSNSYYGYFNDATDTDRKSMEKYLFDEDNNLFTYQGPTGDDNANVYYLVKSASKPTSTEHAYAVFSGKLPINMAKVTWVDVERYGPTYYQRNSDGTVNSTAYNMTEGYSFEPSYRDAEDGGLIDMSNQARTKGTLIGTGVGGAMGGFSGYQGAKQEVADRWTAAVREYKDSLSNFYCATGNRFLGKYNDYIEIPTMNKVAE